MGFIEGDGAILENKGRCRLVITQKDPKSLIEIEKILGFGKVKNFEKYSRFIAPGPCFAGAEPRGRR